MHNSFCSRLMALAAVAAPLLAHAQLSLTVPTYSQDFDSLPTSGSVAPNTVIPGWFVGTGTGALLAGNVLAGTGSSSTGTNYNFGVAGVNAVTDRALGSVAASSTQRDTEFRFVNNLGSAITELTITYTGEQWRVGGASAVNNVLRLQYSYDGASFTVMGAAFDFNTPLDSGTAGALDGNATTNRVTGIGGLFTLPTPLTNGATFFLRWADADDTSSDNGVALDDFALTVNGGSTSLYWDANGVLAGVGGVGVWDTTTSNWNTLADGTGAAQTFGAPNYAVFGGSAGVVTIAAGGVASAALRFDVSGYTLAGGPLTLTGLGTINAIGLSTTITAPISGTAGLTKTGGGLLTLSGPNSFTGNINVNGGSLIFDSDGRLGDAGNDIVLGGGYFIPSTALTLAATRDLSGGGGMQILIGDELTVQGNVNLTSLELVSNGIGHNNGGTLAMNGTNNTVGNLQFSDPATIQISNRMRLEGDVTMAANLANSCTITGNVFAIITNRTFNVVDTPQDVDFLFQGKFSGSGRITKLGAGTLRMVGDNSDQSGGFQLGAAGPTPQIGGRMLISDRAALGLLSGPQFYFNDGTLEAETPLTGANKLTGSTLSLGAGQLASATFAGADMEFSGGLSIFKATGAPAIYTNRMTVNNNVTFPSFGASTGTGPSAGLLIDGAGSLTFSSISTSANELPITVNGPRLIVSNKFILPTATFTIQSGSLEGTGTIAGNTTVNDTISPGTSIGTLTFSNALTLAGTTRMEINRTNSPNCDRIVVAGALTLGGLLTVTNIGPALQSGDKFSLFSWGSVSNGFASITLPAIAPGLTWNTNNFLANGSIEVTAPTILPAFVSGQQLVLRLDTQAGTSYVLQSATNLLATDTIWIDVLTNSGTGGVITNSRPIDPANAREFFRYLAR